MKLAFFAVFLAYGSAMAADFGMGSRVEYVSSSENEHPTFSVHIDYDIKNLSKDSKIWYFKKTHVPDNAGYLSGGSLSIGCGNGSSLYSSVDSSVEDDGIHIDIDIKRTGKSPNKYTKSLLIPWSELDYSYSDESAAIHVITKWNAAQQDAAANP